MCLHVICLRYIEHAVVLTLEIKHIQDCTILKHNIPPVLWLERKLNFLLQSIEYVVFNLEALNSSSL